MNSKMPSRVLVYVVAYEAEKHLEELFERIPAELFNRQDIHFLVSDDASTDNGVFVLKEWLIEHDVRNVTILQNNTNQGYGGNQKIGFRLAIESNFDYLILLHGDGQYAPELLPTFIEVSTQSSPDVILGSRLHSKRAALNGGMPLYKLVGNRLLTRFQNAMTGWSIDEYHTGYRAYSTKFLRKVPFELNSNEFHFDTEILLQAAHVNAAVEQIPIPTHYGKEICRVPGLKYAWDVFTATTQYKMHQMGMLCSLKLRNLSSDRYCDKTLNKYSSHSLAVRLLKRNAAKRVLDIGCGPGYVSTCCKTEGMFVTGVDISSPAAESVDEFFECNLEQQPLPVDCSSYDSIVMLDVIEHLSDPEQFLLDLREASSTISPQVDSGDPAQQLETQHFEKPTVDRPKLFLSTPNIAFAAIRLNLLLGRFNYAERGILDITHKRLFTKKSLVNMLQECGYDIEKVHPVGVPFEAVMESKIGRWLGVTANLFAKIWPSLFAFQFLVECRAKPGVRETLSRAYRIHQPAESSDDCQIDFSCVELQQ